MDATYVFFQVPVCLKHAAALRAPVLLVDLTTDFLVATEVGRMAKFFVTLLTLEWFFTLVLGHVSNEITMEVEALCTCRTEVLE